MAHESLEIKDFGNVLMEIWQLVVRIVLSVVHLIVNKIIVCYIKFTSKCEISFSVTFNIELDGGEGRNSRITSRANLDRISVFTGNILDRFICTRVLKFCID